jgi:hypothetical protein
VRINNGRTVLTLAMVIAIDQELDTRAIIEIKTDIEEDTLK